MAGGSHRTGEIDGKNHGVYSISTGSRKNPTSHGLKKTHQTVIWRTRDGRGGFVAAEKGTWEAKRRACGKITK